MEFDFAIREGSGLKPCPMVFDLYTEEDLDEMIAAQDKYVDAVGIESEVVQ